MPAGVVERAGRRAGRPASRRRHVLRRADDALEQLVAVGVRRQRDARPSLHRRPLRGRRDPAVTCVPPRSSAVTNVGSRDERLHDLAVCSATAPQPVRRRRTRGRRSSRRRRADGRSPAAVSSSTSSPSTRLRTWKRPSVSSSTTSAEVEPVNGEEEVRVPAELEARRSPRPVGRRTARGSARRPPSPVAGAGRGSRTRGRRAPAAADRPDRAAASRRSAACRGTASR